MTQIYNKVALIGLGLIAGSIGLAMKRAGLSGEIRGHARSSETRDTALSLGLVDKIFDTAAEAVEGADLVVLCVPVGVMGNVASSIVSSLKAGVVVSDVGSVKAKVIEMVGIHMPKDVHFIPAHPIAGTENSGPNAGFAELFDGKWTILTPTGVASEDEVAKLRTFWEKLGANVDVMEPERHDLVLSVTSHVPHLIAYTMVGVADDLERVTDKEVIEFSTGGFRDFTRIAASDPTMWRDVFLNNKEATLDILGRFTEELFDLQRAIRRGDGEQLFEHFTRTRAIRRSIIEAGHDTSADDFGRAGTKSR